MFDYSFTVLYQLYDAIRKKIILTIQLQFRNSGIAIHKILYFKPAVPKMKLKYSNHLSTENMGPVISNSGFPEKKG